MNWIIIVALCLGGLFVLWILFGIHTSKKLNNPLLGAKAANYITEAWNYFKEQPTNSAEDPNLPEERIIHNYVTFIGLVIEKLMYADDNDLRLWVRGYESKHGPNSVAYYIFCIVTDIENVHFLEKDKLWDKTIKFMQYG